MIFITDELGNIEKNILELVENVGLKDCKTIEAIDLFCGISEKNDVLKEKDLYYAFIETPQYWSIRADGVNGAIYDNKTKMANIYFKNPIEKRMVSRVEWIDRNNTVYRIDYYNKYGYKYCSENVSGGNVTVREFYDRNGDIKVLEQTGPKTYTTFGTRISPKSYRGFADYLEAYLKYNKIYDENIWLTSDEILNKFAGDYGNFKISYLPQNRLNSDLTVITQTNTAFRILCSEEQQVNWYKENSNYKCDRVYSYFENNELKFGKKEALTITESDQLEYIEQLINDFPEITFHIAASTIMSDKLTRLDINNNVELYPCITEQKRKELFERCDIYLDINHYRELYNAVNEAMVNNMIILAFDNTAHSKELYPMGNIFESSNYVKMKETLKNIITTDTDLFSRLLIEKNIPHNVLNASNAFWEAQIIAGAGQMNAVTVATTMAGRGTDIKLGDGVKELGGLAVIGIGRMNNSRSERQARGRAGRQGDPGFSQYYVSLEDDIVGAEDDDKLQRYIDGKKRIGKRKIKRIVNQCQKLSVESEEMNRKKSLQYDQVLQRQRDLIYATRKKLLDGASVEQEKIVEIAKENISDFVNHFDCIQSNKKHGRRRGRKKDSDKNTNTQQYTSMLNRYILDNISYKLDAGLTLSDMESAATVSDYLMLRVYQGLSRQRERIGDEEAYEQFVREATLKAVDDGWVELIDYLEQLKYAVAGRASAQRNVMFEYQNEAFESFLDTEKAVKCNIIRNILLSDVKIGKDGRLQVIYP